MLSIEALNNHFDIHEWAKYRPFEQHYEAFEPHLIYAAHKIVDVYYAFASARSYISDYECENFGQIITTHDDLHMNFLKSKYLQTALAHYNYAIDLSWQVVWFYLGDNSNLFMERPEFYDKYSKICTEYSLYFKLDISEMAELKNHLSDFFNAESTKDLREIYNYVKHRGSLHTDEINPEYSTYRMSYTQEGKNYLPTMLTRRKFKLEGFKESLMQFDIDFCNYFQKIINWTMPTTFTETEFNIFAVIPSKRWDFHFNQVEKHEKIFLEHLKEFYSKDTTIESVPQDPNKYIAGTNLIGGSYIPIKKKNKKNAI